MNVMAKEPAKIDALYATIQQYFDALYYSDPIQMAAIFHDRGVYATADESPSLIRNKSVYLDVLKKRESPQQRGEERRDAVDSVEFAGAHTALATLRCSIGERDFIDFLSLIYEDDRWQIISKVFHIKD